MTSEHVCARCPKKLGVSCCEAGEGKLATLTDEDITRISDATGLSPARFVTEEWLSHEEAADYERGRPLFRGYFRHAPVRRTLRTRGDACVFHVAGEGCRLDAQTRPLACRLYPFQLLADGTWSILPPKFGSEAEAAASGEGCLAVEHAEGMGELLAAFQVTPEALEALAQALREAVLRHGRR